MLDLNWLGKLLFKAIRMTGGLAFLFLAILPFSAHSQDIRSIDTKARQAILLDFATATILLSKNAESRMYPASMTKLMTAYMVFERLENGSLSLDDTFPVSEKAWRKGGSKMWLEVGSSVRVEDLLKGIIVQSGNDATIVVAEGIAGSEEAFARQMTKRAQYLGMLNTQFRNASGWPDPEHYTTAKDLSILATALIKTFPEYYHLYSTREYTYSNITQQNRNPLLGKSPGADGLKTGYTEASGYGLTASAMRDGQRLVMVVNGLNSTRERRVEAQRLLEWGFREFGTYKLFDPGETVAEIPVWLGKETHVPVIVREGVEIVLRRSLRDQMKVTLKTMEPVAAPFEAQTDLGVVEITVPGRDPVVVPVAAGEPIEKLGSLGRLKAALEFLIFGG